MTIAPQRSDGKPPGIEDGIVRAHPYIMHQALQARHDAQHAEEAQREAEARIDEHFTSLGQHCPRP